MKLIRQLAKLSSIPSRASVLALRIQAIMEAGECYGETAKGCSDCGGT